jgi:hypothetical protein
VFKGKGEERRVVFPTDMVGMLLSLAPGEYEATAEGKKVCQHEGKKFVAKAGGGFYQKMGSCNEVEGLTDGGKVGIAIGVLVFVGIVLAVLHFFVLPKCAFKEKLKSFGKRFEPPGTDATALVKDEIGE